MPWEAWVLAVMFIVGCTVTVTAVVEDLRAMRDRHVPESYPYIKTAVPKQNSKIVRGRHRLDRTAAQSRSRR